MPTLTQVRQQMLAQYGLGFVVPNAQFTAAAATTITSTHLEFTNTNYGQQHFSQDSYLVNRYLAATANRADDVRAAGDLTRSTGVLTIAGANVSDTTTTSESFEMIKWGLHPVDDFLRAINRAQTELGGRDLMALSLAADSSQWLSASSSYTESDSDAGPATTFTKVTTVGANIFPGQRRAGRVLNAAANGYVRQRFNVTRGEQVYTGVFVRADVGEFNLKWQDISNTVALGTAVSSTQETYQYVHRLESVGSTTEILEIRLQAVGTTDDFYFGPFFVYRMSQNRMVLPAEITEEYQIEAVVCATFHQTTASGVEDAMSIETMEVPHDDYGFFFSSGQGQQNFIEFHNGSHQHWLRYPLFLQVRLPDSEITTLSAEADVTNIPLKVIVPKAMINLCDIAGGKLQNVGALRQQAMIDLANALGPRRVSGPAQRKVPTVRYRTPS